MATQLHIDGASGAGGGAAATVAGWTSTSGSTIVVIGAFYHTANAAQNGDVTDSKSNTYTLAPSLMGGSNAAGIAVYYNIGGTRGASHTVTLNHLNSSGETQNIHVIEISGSSITYQSSSAATANDTTSPFAVTAAAALNSNSFGIYGCALDTGDSNAWGQPTGYSNIYNEANGASAFVSIASYKLGESGTPAPAATNSDTVGSGSCRQAFVSFYEAGGDASVSVPVVSPTLTIPAPTITTSNPYVVASIGASLSTNDPSVTFSGYTPLENDIIAFYISSTTVLDVTANASLPAGWVNPLGDGVEINSDAHGMACVYHKVTAAEQTAVTLTYTATDSLQAAETGYVQAVAIRNVDPTTPVDGANTAQGSGNTVTPHVLAGITGSGVLLGGSLVVSSVAKDATGAYSSVPSGWTQVRADNTNNGRWIGYRNAHTALDTDVAATDITPSAGDEYASITIAWAMAPLPATEVTPAVVSLTLSIPAPTVAANAGPTPAVISPSLTIPTPTVTLAAALATVGPTLSIPAPTLSADPTVSVDVVSPSLTIPVPTVSTSTEVTTSTVAPTLTIPTPTITLAAALSTVGPTLTVPPPTASASTAITVAVVTLTLTIPVPTLTTHKFVTSISGRRLHDQDGADIVMRCMSSWALAQNLSDADITTALEGLEARHFNTVNVWMFGYNLNGTWDPYTAGNGSAVFTGTPYQSSLGAGWDSMDWVVSEAARLGLNVIMSLYTAYGVSGARADMEAASNAQMTTFGAAVATRYAAYDNIIWHVGADDFWLSSHTIGERVDAFFQGVNGVEGSARPVRLVEPNGDGSTTGYSQFSDWYGASNVAFTVNSLYDYGDDAVVQADAVHNESGATSFPWWDCEPAYRYSDHYGNVTTIEPQEIRERLWSVFIRGGIGINYGNEDFWPFGATGLYTGGRTWEQVLTDDDTAWAMYCWDTLDLVGNTDGWTRDSGGFITSGLGSGDTKAASAYSTEMGLVYLPDSRSVTADLTEFSGSFASCLISKIDPTTGTTTTIGTYSTSGSQVISALGNNASSTFSDWVLLFEGVPGVEATPSTVQPTLTIPAPSISAGVTIILAAVGPSLTVPAPTVTTAVTVTLTAVGPSLSIPAPSISAGVTVTTDVVQPTLTTPAPSISAGVALTLDAIPLTLSIPTPTAVVSTAVTVDAVAPTLTIPAPTVAANAGPTPAVVGPTLSIPAPSISAGVTVTATVVGPTLTTPTPSISAGVTLVLTAVSPTLTVPDAGIIVSVTVTTTTVAPALTIPTPLVTTGGDAAASAGTVTLALTIPTPTASASTTVAVAVVSPALTVPDPTATTALAVTTTTIAPALTTPTPSISAGVTITVAVIGPTLTVYAVTAFTAVTVSPSTVAPALTVPDSTISVDNAIVVTPGVVQPTLALPAPVLSADATIAISTVALILGIFLPIVTTSTNVTVQVLHSITRYAHPGMRTYVSRG